MLPGVVFAIKLLMLTTIAAAQSIVWDDFNARVWTINSEHPEDRQRVVREWIQDDDRFVLRITYRPGDATSRYLLAFTHLLSPESLRQVREIRFALKWDRRPTNATLRLQAKQLLAPYAKADERLIVDEPVPLRSGGYQEYRVPIQTTAALSRLLFVFENVQGAPSEIYLDYLRFVGTEQAFVWESFDHRPRRWVPVGAWSSWAGPTEHPLLDMISTYDGFPGGPSGALLLHWDARPGRRENVSTRGAELKTAGYAVDPMDRGHALPGLNADFSAFSTLSADVSSTNPSTLGIFFGHYIDGTSLIDQGFITPGVQVVTPGIPQRLSWDIPWPPHFPADDVDVVSFVVRDTEIPGLAAGTLRIDNVEVSPAALPHPDASHAIWYLSHFDFDARHDGADRSGVRPDITFLGGNMGTFSPTDALAPQKVKVRHDATQSAHIAPTPGASFRVDLDLHEVDFVGGFISLFGHSDFKDAYTLDLTQFSQLQLSLRPSDTHTAPMWLRIEIKDYRDSHDYTAYRYVHIPAAPVTWHRIVLDADITDPTHWRFNRFPPDPTRAKFLNLVVERFFNAQHLTFYVDELRLVHKTDKPFRLPEAQRQSQNDGLDTLLAHVQHKAWLHFDRWVVDGVASNPDLYLFLDRSSFPDLISTAAAGFGLAALVVGHRSGWLSEAEATSRVLRVLRTYADGRMIDDPSTVEPSDLDASIGVKGWFWHFLERDGTRKRTTYYGDPLPPAYKSELSSVDTAIFLWGALAARDYFRSTNPQINPLGPSPRAAEIAELVARIYHRIDFPFFRRAENAPPGQGQIYLGWKPEWIDASMSSGIFTVPVPGFPDGQAGYFSGMPEDPATWDRPTDETLMILLLGAASPNARLRLPASVFPLQAYLLHPSPLQTYTATCENEVVGPILPSFFGSGFTYFFLQNFFKADRRLEPLLGLNLFLNAQRAARASWLYSRCGANTNAPTFEGNVFGLTAAEGRDGNYHGEWGAPPREASVATDDGTVAVYGPLGYLPLWPDDFSDPDRVAFRNPSMDALVTLFREGRIFDDAMGFGDVISLVPEPDTGLRYYNMTTFGIDNGSIVMGIENERSGLFWRLDLLCREMAAAGIGWSTDGACAGVAKRKSGR